MVMFMSWVLSVMLALLRAEDPAIEVALLMVAVLWLFAPPFSPV